MTDNVAEIAASLTKAQREAVRDCEWMGSGVSQFAVVDCLQRLPTPMVNMLTLRWDRLTPLGLAVRAYLTGEQR